jgi:hypothetical protein
MRTKRVRVSDEEHARLKQYRNSEYSHGIPLGFVIGQLLDEVADDE